MSKSYWAYCRPDGTVHAHATLSAGTFPAEMDGFVLVQLDEPVPATGSKKVDLVTRKVSTYQPPAPGNDDRHHWVWDASIERWVAVPQLLAMQDAKWEVIKAARDRSIDEPLSTDWGVFDHDAKSRQAILEVATGASVTSSSVIFTLADDTEVKLEPKQIAAVLALSHTRVQVLREQANEIRTLIYGVGSASDLEGIQWQS